MNEKPLRNRNKPKQSSRAKNAARDPKPGAINRPGFDLGGATGDAKPSNKTSVPRSMSKTQGAVKEKPGKPNKTQSAVAGVKNWLRGK